MHSTNSLPLPTPEGRKGAGGLGTIAVSTMWGAQGRYPDLGDMVDGVRDAGGDRIEINYMPTREQLEQLLARPDAVISSVHNICPRPTDAAGNRIPDPSLVAADADERRHAIALTKGTMDLCRRVGGAAIVVHAGDLVVDIEAEQRLDVLYFDRQHESDEFLATRQQIIDKRAALSGPAIAQLLASLADLVPYAEATGIKLGIETRQDYRDIPTIDELGVLLDRFASPMLGYWHDTGHAARLHALGYTPHEEWLRRHGDRLVAMHLHDCIGLRDHLIPGRGRVDWRMVVSYLRPDTLPVAELDHYFAVADIREGLDFLRAAGFERGGVRG